MISASLSINLARISANGVDLSPIPSVGPSVSVQKVYCGKMDEWIRMPFGIVRGVGRVMGVLDGGGNRQIERGSIGVNLGRPIISNGDFVT